MQSRILITAAALAVMAAPAFAETQTVMTKQVSADGSGGTTTTTTRYYYDDADTNHNGILDSQEFPHYVYNRWDLDGDGFVSDAEWNLATARWYPSGYTAYKTYTFWDKDRDGRLDADEVGSVVASTDLYKTWDENADQKLESGEYADSTFRLFDKNNDGTISMSEWRDAQ